jgi:hypothetical protein
MSSALALENGRTERTALHVTGFALASLTFQSIGNATFLFFVSHKQ